MSQDSFQERLNRIQGGKELPVDTMQFADRDQNTPSQAQEDTTDFFVEYGLGISISIMAAIFFFDKDLAMSLVPFAVPVIGILAITVLVRALRRGAADTLDTGLDLVDNLKTVMGWLK